MSKKDNPPKVTRTAEDIEKAIAIQQQIIKEAKARREEAEKIAQPLREKKNRVKTVEDNEKKTVKKVTPDEYTPHNEAEDEAGKPEEITQKLDEEEVENDNEEKVDILQKQAKLELLREELRKAEEKTRWKKGGDQKVLDIENEIREIENEIRGEKESSEEQNPTTKNTQVEDIKKDLNKTFQTQEIKKENELILERLKVMGLTEKDFENNNEWGTLSTGEKLLVMEQLSQETLSHVKEIGEKRFQEKNKMNFSWKPTKWNPFSLGKKIWNHLGKAYWISKEEKQVIEEAEAGKIKPSDQSIQQMIERTADMHLNIAEKDGRAVIEFIPIDKNLPVEQQKIIAEYNKVANEFARMPDSWRNEKSANSKDTRFHKKNFENFNRMKTLYENAKSELLNIKKEQYIKSGIKEGEAGGKAMLEIKDGDFKIAILQFLNTNPDTVRELNRIKNESSWGRLLNNENIWRTIYMGVGFGARSVTVSTFGLLAAPIVAGAMGGIRARKKAMGKIESAFSEGRNVETSRERRETGKRGLFDDKDTNRNLLSKTLSGYNVSAKEVGAFVDADSQIQRLDNIIKKIEQAKTDKEKLSFKNKLNSRINYIEDKHDIGLINYGTKNVTATNYELFKKLSYARAQLSAFDFIDKNTEQSKNDERKVTLLWKIMAHNEARFGKKQAHFKNQEILRGAIVAGGFARLGQGIRALMYGVESGAVDMSDFNNPAKFTLPGQPDENLEKILESHIDISATADHGQGAISTLRELQHNLKAEYGNNLENAPASVKHILNTDAHKLAEEYGMYKPGEDAESIIMRSGSSFHVDESGNVSFHEAGGNSDVILEKGTSIKADQMYEGKMIDTDNSGVKVENNVDEVVPVREPDIPHMGRIIEPEVDTTGGPTGTGIDSSNLVDNPYKLPTQVDPETGEPLKINNEGLSSGRNLEEGLAYAKVLNQIDNVYKSNIGHMFPDEKSMHAWEGIKNSTDGFSAGKLITRTMENTNETYQPVVSLIKKIHEVTGLEPRAGTDLQLAESPDEYIRHGLIEAEKMGRLEEVKLLENISPNQVTPEPEIVKLDTNIEPETGQIPKGIETPPAQPTGESPFAQALPENNLTPDIRAVYEENIKDIFPRKQIWYSIKNKTFMDALSDNSISSNSELASYLEKLKEATGIEPEQTESINHYMVRALEEAKNIEKLDAVRLEGGELLNQTPEIIEPQEGPNPSELANFGIREVSIDNLRDLKKLTEGYEGLPGQPPLKMIMEDFEGKGLHTYVTEDVGETSTAAQLSSEAKMNSALPLFEKRVGDFDFFKTLPNGIIKGLHIRFYK